MKCYFKICICLLFLLNSWACVQNSQPERVSLNNNSNKNLSSEKNLNIGSNFNVSKNEIKPLINFFSLVNKSPVQIEKIYGKPLLIETKSIQFKDGEFRKYNIFENNEEDLQVDYYKGKAVQFFLDIPEKFQTKSLEEAIRLCGFNLDISDAQTTKMAIDYWWDKPLKAAPFYSIHIRKFNDSGLFYNCEALMRVQ